MTFSLKTISRASALLALATGTLAFAVNSNMTRAAGSDDGTPSAQQTVQAGSLATHPPASLADIDVALPQQAIVSPPAPDRAATGLVTPTPVSGLGLPCTVSVTASALPGAMVALDVMAPCQPEAEILISHAGLTLHMETDAFGLLTADIPALETPAFFDVTLPDGQIQTALVALPDLSEMSRVALHWDGDGAFALHAMEFGAAFGEPGHVWRDAPGSIPVALTGAGGFLSDLTVASTGAGTQAQIYTLPHGSLRDGDVVRLSVDVEVTEQTCGQTVEAQALRLDGGAITDRTPLSLTLPGCEAVGDYLVLQNLFQDLRLAAN